MDWYWSIIRAVVPADWYWVGAIPLILGIAAALWFAWWLWWRLPKRQVGRLSLKIRDAKARADVVIGSHCTSSCCAIRASHPVIDSAPGGLPTKRLRQNLPPALAP
jgi:hypothetical protein